ncbi:hypothetical protein ASAP_2424 [Asaia bogorensis]|uniref:Uncharacterized protein n=1 Tax=Asaia bogorensis TaxID=91915 RepID=A0A060QH33_9PROT|nr:hypothetical protein ASAP_2424 [Asaia bogorensis]
MRETGRHRVAFPSALDKKDGFYSTSTISLRYRTETYFPATSYVEQQQRKLRDNCAAMTESSRTVTYLHHGALPKALMGC